MHDTHADYLSALARVKLTALEAIERLIRTTADPVELRRLALGVIKTATPAKPRPQSRAEDTAPQDLDEILEALLAAAPPQPAADQDRRSAAAPHPLQSPSNHPAPLTLCSTPARAITSHAGVAKPIDDPTATRRRARQATPTRKNPP